MSGTTLIVPSNSWTAKSLICWFHPGMKLPACLASVNMKAAQPCIRWLEVRSHGCNASDVSREDYPFTIVSELLVMELMEKVEARSALGSKRFPAYLRRHRPLWKRSVKSRTNPSSSRFRCRWSMRMLAYALTDSNGPVASCH